MKLKYYLRGLGIGILFATIIMAVAVSGRLNDKEVVKRAKAMGMDYTTTAEKGQNEQTGETTLKADKTETKDNTTKEKPKETETKETTTKETTTKETTTKETTTKETTTKETTTKETTTKEETTTKKKPTEKEVEFSITSGMSSVAIAQLLESLGVVDNASEFDSYLVENNYDSRIAVGDYSISKSASYYQIAELISN